MIPAQPKPPRQPAPVAHIQAYRDEKARLLRERSKLLTNTSGAIIEMLQMAARTIVYRLADQPADYLAWNLKQLQREVQQQLAVFATQAEATLGTAAGTAWQAGMASVDAPLEAGGVRVSALVPVLDTRQLTAMRAFMTDRIANVSVQAVNQINTELGLVTIGAQPVTEAITAVKAILGEDSRDRALTIVRTELARAYAVASQERMAQAATIVPGMKKQWRRSGKLHSRLSHDLADGQIVDVDKPFTIHTKSGPVQMMFPHDPKAPPGETINCGCVALSFKAGWDVANPGRRRFTEREIAANSQKAEIQAALDSGESVADVLSGRRKRAA